MPPLAGVVTLVARARSAAEPSSHTEPADRSLTVTALLHNVSFIRSRSTGSMRHRMLFVLHQNGAAQMHTTGL
jgi:hypothetical protein